MRGLLIAFCIALAALVCVPQQVDAGNWRGRNQNQAFGFNGHQNGVQFNVGGFGFNIQNQNRGFGFQQQGHRPQFQQNRNFQTQAFVDPFGRVFVRNRNGVLVRVR